MKNTSKQHFFLVLALCSFVLILRGQSAYARDTNPPEIQVLVGMKIPPKNNTTPGGTPGFRSVAGGLLVLAPGNKTWTGIPSLNVGFFYKTPIFILSRLYPDKSAEIMDVQTLPKTVLEMQLKDGKVIANINGYRFSENCSQLNPTTRKNELSWYFGLVKPEKDKLDCTHNSRRVFKAWRVDQRNGKIEEIPSHTMQCEYFTMDNCN